MNWRSRPWLVVLSVGVIAGVGFAFLIPPLAGYDEPYHFLRAYQVSEGHVVAEHHGKQFGGDMPAELSPDLSRLLTDGLFSRDRTTVFKHFGDAPPRGASTFVDFAPSAVYPPVPYAPSSLLMAIGRAFGASTLVLMYLGRLGSLLATIALLALAVARMPSRKWMLVAVALLPVTVLQAAMLSADGVTIALALLVVALALDVGATPRGAVAKRRLVEVAIATVALGFTKPPYILFALLFAIPWRRHGGTVARALLAVVVAGFAASAVWSVYASHSYVAPNFPNPTHDPFAAYTHVDPQRQEHLVAHHPLRFLHTIERTLSLHWHNFLHDGIAQTPLNPVPPWVVVIGVVIVLAAAIVPLAEPPSLLRWRARAFVVAIALLTFAALMVLAYAGWNAVGAPSITAFQGRYLVPLLPLALVVLPARTRARSADGRARVELLLTAASTVLLVAVFFWLRSQYYS
jgi:uncharacterized membrane protein